MNQRHAVSSIGQLDASMRCGDEIVTGGMGTNVTPPHKGGRFSWDQLLL
jgi:hypothetical protein